MSLMTGKTYPGIIITPFGESLCETLFLSSW